MTTQELRELDGWIAENLFGWKVDFESGRRKHGPGYMGMIKPNDNSTWATVPCYCTVSSFAMDVLKKCAEHLGGQEITISPNSLSDTNTWEVASIDWEAECLAHQCEAETLEFAICLFAKQLFSQTTTK